MRSPNKYRIETHTDPPDPMGFIRQTRQIRRHEARRRVWALSRFPSHREPRSERRRFWALLAPLLTSPTPEIPHDH